MYLDRNRKFENTICDTSKKYKFITILIEYASFSKLYDFDKLMVICFTNEAINLDESIPDEDCVFIICDFKSELDENDSKSRVLTSMGNIIHFKTYDIRTCFTDVITQCAKLIVNVNSIYRSDLDIILTKICK